MAEAISPTTLYAMNVRNADVEMANANAGQTPKQNVPQMLDVRLQINDVHLLDFSVQKSLKISEKNTFPCMKTYKAPDQPSHSLRIVEYQGFCLGCCDSTEELCRDCDNFQSGVRQVVKGFVNATDFGLYKAPKCSKRTPVADSYLDHLPWQYRANNIHDYDSICVPIGVPEFATIDFAMAFKEILLSDNQLYVVLRHQADHQLVNFIDHVVENLKQWDCCDIVTLARIVLIIAIEMQLPSLEAFVMLERNTYGPSLFAPDMQLKEIGSSVRRVLYLKAQAETIYETFSVIASKFIDDDKKKAATDMDIWIIDVSHRISRLRLDFKNLYESFRCELENSRNDISHSEAQSVKRLAILAAVFLPASLASSLLAMATRFKDLHLLLWDFFGVFVLLGSVVFVLFVGISFIYTRARRYLEMPSQSSWSTCSNTLTIAGVFGVPWLVLLTSFLVGMFGKARTGAIILGAGLASAIIAGIILLVLARCFDRKARGLAEWWKFWKWWQFPNNFWIWWKFGKRSKFGTKMFWRDFRRRWM